MGCFSAVIAQLLSFQLNLVNKFPVASSEPAALIAVYLVQRLCDGRGSPVEIPQPDVLSRAVCCLVVRSPRDAAGRGPQFFFADFAGFFYSAAWTCLPCLGRGGNVAQ